MFASRRRTNSELRIIIKIPTSVGSCWITNRLKLAYNSTTYFFFSVLTLIPRRLLFRRTLTEVDFFDQLAPYNYGVVRQEIFGGNDRELPTAAGQQRVGDQFLRASFRLVELHVSVPERDEPRALAKVIRPALSGKTRTSPAYLPTFCFSRVVPRPDLTNIFLLNSCVGSTLFIVGRPHLGEASLKLRVLYR